MIARILNRLAARRLAKRGHEAQRERIHAKARAMRCSDCPPLKHWRHSQ